MLVAFVGEFFQHVTCEGCRIHDVVVCPAAVKHGESFMVACGETDVFGSAGFDGSHPVVCVETTGIKSTGHFGIFVAVEIVVGHGPFPLGKHTIESPVEENAETVGAERFA